ncbi:DUF6090 family protein [Psychroserpens mesophilus]|uniref:DUF6090 family protein n=1 Tax=Psychroserpens mesophilus TaxID=325473 RepID=UPI0029345351|nr:DUF6090 family protein [Psychroserpens mesophilus]
MGEIVLVVIGILIALQINNWNENRKERAIEIVLLENLQNNRIDILTNNEPFVIYLKFLT